MFVAVVVTNKSLVTYYAIKTSGVVLGESSVNFTE